MDFGTRSAARIARNSLNNRAAASGGGVNNSGREEICLNMKDFSPTGTDGLEPLAGEKGFLLEELTWQEAEKLLSIDTVIVIPIGAVCKEHGPHLKLKNDWLLAEYFKKEILKSAKVVIGPTINCHYYPAFTEYPGSISLRLETARELVVDICRSLSRPGPRKFYALNTGISSKRPLEE